jgi:hypothetical protein
VTKWEKFKKFVNDHETEIVKLTYYTVGVMVGTYFTTKLDQKKMRGMEVCCGGMRQGSNDTIFDVYLRNDKVISWTRPFEYEPRT